MTSVIRTEGLTKRYGALTVVDGIDLDVPEADVFGFLGPNGSGKTTTIRMLLGLVLASTGTIEVLGHDIPAGAATALVDVGAIVEGPAFYPYLSGRKNLTLFDAAGKGGPRTTRRRRIADVLDRVGLGGVDDRPVKAYSMGMRQRLGIANALLRAPRLLVLDEPTNGLDPQGINELRLLLHDLAAGGTTVFLSSHLLAEVEAICTRAAMMASGRLVAQDRVDRLMAPTGRVTVEATDPHAARGVLAALVGAGGIVGDGPRLTVELDGHAPEQLNEALVRAGIGVRELVVERRSLEDAYLDLTEAVAMLAVELRRLLTRRRTWCTIALLAGLPVLVGVFLRQSGIAPRPGQGPALLSEVLRSGVLFPAAALALVLPIFLPVATAVMAGDTIAGEAAAGTLRYLLIRPVGRTRLLVAKLVGVAVFVVLAVVVVVAVGYVAGAVLFGFEPISSISGSQLSYGDIALRTGFTMVYVAVSMLGLAAIAVFASTWTDSPLAAALAALATFVTSQVLDLIDATAAIQPFLPTHYWLAFIDLFRDPILWHEVLRGLALQAVYLVVLLGAAWAHLATKDVTS